MPNYGLAFRFNRKKQIPKGAGVQSGASGSSFVTGGPGSLSGLKHLLLAILGTTAFTIPEPGGLDHGSSGTGSFKTGFLQSTLLCSFPCMTWKLQLM